MPYTLQNENSINNMHVFIVKHALYMRGNDEVEMSRLCNHATPGCSNIQDINHPTMLHMSGGSRTISHSSTIAVSILCFCYLYYIRVILRHLAITCIMRCTATLLLGLALLVISASELTIVGALPLMSAQSVTSLNRRGKCRDSSQQTIRSVAL